ncbi:MAG: redox-regulated ATPase YchF [Bacteroidales bacterium]|nr:redox-regulated ATPase YchF [Bacteroidales bacterium]
MALRCGIVGLPNVGKSTLFNCVSSGKAQALNFPFCTIEPNLGSTQVPDHRLEDLARLVNPKRIVPATVDFVDIAGLVQGASKGEGLGNQFLANIRETDAILHVIRCFDNSEVTHVSGSVDPVRDMEIIETELQIKDFETVENRLAKVQKQAIAGGDKSAARLAALLERYYQALSRGKSARTVELLNPEEKQLARGLFLLTNKPVLYICNVDEDAINKGNSHTLRLTEVLEKEKLPYLLVAASAESQIAKMEDPDERQQFLAMLGMEESGVSRLVRAAYKLLGLETYFTAGPDEVRAWTFLKGTKAPQAAGLIHSDFERGFIRAEVIKFEDYMHYGSESACREAGKIAVEGKNYVVQDGDVVHILFSR